MFFAGSMLLEHITGSNLGVDIAHRGVEATMMTPHPGRMSPNACVVFLMFGSGLAILQYAPSNAGRRATWILFAVGSLIALIGALGYWLHLEKLYRIAAANRFSFPVASGLCFIAMSAWAIRQAWDSGQANDIERHEQRITAKSIGILLLVAIVAGASGFSVLQSTLEASQEKNLDLAASVNAESLADALAAAASLSRQVATNPAVARQLARLNDPRNASTAREFFDGSAPALALTGSERERFVSDGGTSVAVGRSLLSGHDPSLKLATGFEGSRIVYSNGGYVFASELQVRDGDRHVGRLSAEIRLPLFDRLIARLRDADASTDVLICSRSGDAAQCLPSRFYPTAVSIPMLDANGQINLPINQALLGQSGVSVATDLRGIAVVAAYRPIGATGLAMVIKTQVGSVYEPIRDRFIRLLLLLLILVGMGTIAMRTQVRPLVRQLASERRRLMQVIENSNDAFVAIDSAGRITDWNAQAQRTFGWSADEAIGKQLATLLIPPERRAVHDMGMVHFTRTGEGPVIERRVEVEALHRDGHRVSVELFVAPLEKEDHFVATAFLRDISARKAAERALRHSERSLRLIADNVPALISHLDKDFRYTFTNRRYQEWFSLSETTLVGKTVAEVFGQPVFDGVKEKMTAALGGSDVSFELAGSIPDAPRQMQVHYLPDRDGDGRIVGIYGMVIDRTEQHEAKERLRSSQRQLRAVTDNLPVLIMYLDSDLRVQFMNETFREWIGVDIDTAVGRPLSELVGSRLFEERASQLRQALGGDRVEFDIESTAQGIQRSLHTIYIPDVDEGGSVRGVFTLSMDITALKSIERELKHLSRVDPLTNLPNRRQFDERLNEALGRARRTRRPMALLFVDIDDFKAVNDSLGHGAGDLVLREIAARLKAGIRETDIAARLAGDEFVVVLEELRSSDEAEEVARKLVEAMRHPMAVTPTGLVVTVSLGVASCEGEELGAQEICARADRALYAAKAAGRNTFAVDRHP